MVLQRDWKTWASLVVETLNLQPFWRNRLQAVWFELKTAQTLKPSAFLNKSKWKGRHGYGVRFPGWKEAFDSHSVLEFNALQWARSVQKVREDLHDKSQERYLEVRYEEFCRKPAFVLDQISRFLGFEAPPVAVDDIHTGPIGNWMNKLSIEDRRKIGPIIGDLLIELCYTNDHSWYR